MRLTDPRIHRHELDPWQEGPERSRARLAGEIAHKALELAGVRTGDDDALRRAARLAHAWFDVAADEAEVEKLAERLRAALTHPEAAPFFAPDAVSLNEIGIIAPRTGRSSAENFAEFRADRLVILPDGSLWVIDYKSGLEDSSEHGQQVRGYARLLAEIFDRPCHPALIYLDGPQVRILEPVAPPRERRGETSPPDAGRTAFTSPPCPPIRAAAPRRDILADLAADLLTNLHDPADPLRLASGLLVFPHARPRIYLLRHLMSALGRPFLAPRCLSLREWITAASFAPAVAPDSAEALPSLNELDQAWTIYEAVAAAPGRSTRFGAGLDWERFLPWGLRLTSIMEELDREGREAEDIIVPPDDLPPLAGQILAELGQVRQAYRDRLAELGRETSGMRLSRLAKQAEHGTPPVVPEYSLFCGFTALTGNESVLFRGLWEQGTRFWWQTGPDLDHFHAEWRKDWGVEVEVATSDDPAPQPEPTFIRAHDLHSELRGLAGELRDLPPDAEAVVILPEPGHLLPLLASLPEEVAAEVNITLGYPLGRTALSELLHTASRLASPRNPDLPAHRGEDFLALWHNPWVRRTLPQGLRALLRRTLSEMSRSFVFAEDLRTLSESVAKEHGRDNNPYFILCELFFETGPRLRTLEQLAAFLRRLMSILQADSTTVSTVENEFAHALQAKTLPLIERAACRDRELSPPALWRLFLRLLDAERAAFVGHPLTRRQVMGLLESRLLSFEHVFVLDLNEGVLPPVRKPDPLMPEEIRRVLDLPPGHAAEEVSLHHLRRLVQGAGQVRLFCQAGASGNPLEGKKTPSRFWEEFLWERERQAGRVLDGTIRDVPFEIVMDGNRPPLPRKEDVRDRLDELMRSGLSPSAMNAYLSCPLQFYFSRIARIEPPFRPDEDESPRILGDIAHKTLELLFAPLVGRDFVPAESVKRLEDCFARAFATIAAKQPPRPETACFGGRLILAALTGYLENQTAPTRILALEASLTRNLDLGGRSVRLKGRADRIDRTAQGHPLVLDYKTGGAALKRSLTTADLTAMSEAALRVTPDRDGQLLLAEHIPDLQLLSYAFMAEGPAEAAYLFLTADPGKELQPLWREGRGESDDPDDFFTWQRESLPEVLRAVIRHLLETPEFNGPVKPENCQSCDFIYACPWRES